MAAKENFFKAHWELFVALAGLAALGGAAAMLVPELGQGADAAVAEQENELRSVKPKNDSVAAADLSVLEASLKLVKTPPALTEVDPKKASFLASERRILCRAGEGADPKKACGKPIAAASTTCPFCGIKQPALVKVEIDSDHDGLPNDWEIKYAFNKDDASDAAQDADKDGFTNLEEYEAKTDPRDPKSHPDYLDYVSVQGAYKQTFLKFYFKQANPMPGNTFRLTFQRLGVKSKFDSTFAVKVGEPIKSADGKVDTGYTAKAYNVKDVEVPAYKGSKMMKKIKVGFVDIERKDGKTLTIRENDRNIPVETEIQLVYARDGGKTFTVSTGSVFEIRGSKYRVLKLETKGGKPAVTVEDVAAKKQKIVQGA